MLIEIFLDIAAAMNDYEFFLLVPAASFVCGLVMLFRSFLGRGVSL